MQITLDGYLYLWKEYIYEKFQSKYFIVQKTKRLFSKDHIHEWNNKAIRERGGIIGILDSHSQKTWQYVIWGKYVLDLNKKHHEYTEAHKH